MEAMLDIGQELKELPVIPTLINLLLRWITPHFLTVKAG
jgi:hypothetical protein